MAYAFDLAYAFDSFDIYFLGISNMHGLLNKKEESLVSLFQCPI